MSLSTDSKRVVSASLDTFREYFQEFCCSRYLLAAFIRRDLQVKYKHAVLGVLWLILRPMLTMAMFTIIFGLIARFPSQGVPYPLFVLAAMIPWQFIINVLNDSCSCFISNSHLLKKTYFPRLYLLTSLVVVHLIELVINLFILSLLAAFTGYFSWHTAPFALFYMLGALCFGFAAALFLSILTVKYRDVSFLIAFFVQFGMFFSPVGYGTFMIPQYWSFLYALNPMVGIIDGFRYSFFGITYPHIFQMSMISFTSLSLLLISGLFYFRRSEHTVIDYI